MTHGDMDHALADERTALNLRRTWHLAFECRLPAPETQRFKQSLDYLDERGGTVLTMQTFAKLSGWAYYGLNKLDQAVAE